MVGDGGGKAPQWARPISGAAKVALFRDRDGKVVNTMALDILGGRVQTIRSVINPDKLRHVGPVADAWAVLREASQARRSAD
jgi:RNA polymerase sigma-70 factor (ECF subfamily)